jgi:hypothetical protein
MRAYVTVETLPSAPVTVDTGPEDSVNVHPYDGSD